MSLASGPDAPQSPASASTRSDHSPGHTGPGPSGSGPSGSAPSHAAWFAARRRAAATGTSDDVLDSTTGLSPHTASVLCYAVAWVSALIVLVVERDSRLVRFHALQSAFAFGALCLLAVGCGAMTVVSAFYSTGAFQFFAWASELSWVAMVVLWVVALVCVTRNAEWRMPVIAKFAERWA
jgi:uncharacterized membrane protein